MKKKIALLLAVIMIASLLPTSVFADSNNALTYTASSSRGRTVLVEETAITGRTQAETDDARAYLKAMPRPVGASYGGDGVPYAQVAPVLTVEIRDNITTGQTFYVDLQGARWAMDKMSGLDGSYTWEGSIDADIDTIGGNTAWDPDKGEFFTQATLDGQLGNGAYLRYSSRDLLKADITGAPLLDAGVSGGKRAVELANGGGLSFAVNATAVPSEIAYVMHFVSDTRAVVTILESYLAVSTTTNNPDNPRLVIPVTAVVDQGATAMITVSKDPNSNRSANVTSGSADRRVAEGRPSGTTIEFEPKLTNRELFPMTAFTITETRAGTLAPHGYFEIEAPFGFEFVTNQTLDRRFSFAVVTESNLNMNNPNMNTDELLAAIIGIISGQWTARVVQTGIVDIQGLYTVGAPGTESINYAVRGRVGGGFSFSTALRRVNDSNDDNHGYPNTAWGLPALDSTNTQSIAKFNAATNSTGPSVDRIYFGAGKNGQPDYTRAYVHYSGIVTPAGNPGVVSFEGVPLMLRAYDNAAFGDVLVNVRSVNSSAPGDTGGCESNISAQQGIKVGTRTDWALTFSSSGAPELFNGRFEGNPTGTADAWHKAGSITIEENLPGMWNTNMKTILSLPEGVKFSKAVVHFDNTVVEAVNNAGLDRDYPKYFMGGTTASYVEISDQELVMSGLSYLSASSRTDAKAVIDIWVTVESGYGNAKGEGVEIEITLGGDAVPTEMRGLTEVIAVAYDPIVIEVEEISILPVGNQTISTADFRIVENYLPTVNLTPLRRGETVKVALADLVDAGDIGFYTVEYDVVSEGGFRITNKVTEAFPNQTAVSGSLLKPGTGAGISFDIGAESVRANPGIIEFTGVQVKIDRSQPESNKPVDGGGYDILVWGNAVAENFNVGPASHRVPGIRAPYIRLRHLSDSILNSRVDITVGENEYRVNGQRYDMGAAAYIDEATDSVMVPVRFIAASLAGYASAPDSEDSPVKWDGATRSVTIYSPDGSVIQFVVDSDKVSKNGEVQTMFVQDGSGRTVKAYLDPEEERVYIPFRWLGNVLGVPVDWDNETKTAIYNPQVEYNGL